MDSRKKELLKRFGGNVTLEKINGCLYLSGEVSNWEDAVSAGQLCAKSGSRTHVVNDIRVSALEMKKTKIPSFTDEAIDGKRPDVLIIGAGIVGCAIARELSKWNLDVLLVEKEYDVALHASSRNDGMVHPGIDIHPGLVKKKLNNRGNRIYTRICSELNVPFDRCGQFLCFNEKKILPILYMTLPYWLLTGVGAARVHTYGSLRKKEPDVSPEVKCALEFKRAGIVCPYGLTIAYAENAVQNGVKLSLDTAVLKMKLVDGRIKAVKTNRGTVFPKLVINAAGVFAEEIAELAGDRFFSIHPRKGTNSILDRKARRFVNTTYSLMGTQSKDEHTKGGGIVGTVDGNVLVGPDAIETPDKENFDTDAQSIKNTFLRHSQVAPWLKSGDIITYFTGVRAPTYEEDFIVEPGRRTKNILHAAGIQSPGLTAAPAIGEEIAKLAVKQLKKTDRVEKNNAFNPIRVPILRPSEMSKEERAALIEREPDYGEIVCRCEEVSRGEIIAALHRPVPCRTVDGVKRRVRPGMGRCQGGFCGPLVLKLISQNLGIPEEKVRKSTQDSELLFGPKGAAL